MTGRVRAGLWAALTIAAVLGVLALGRKPLPLSAFDQPFYLGIADDLIGAGRFTDGFMFATPGPDGTRPPGMRFAPFYPALLAASAFIDPALRRGMACVVATADRDASCPSAAPSVRGLQWGLLCLVYWLVWWLGTMLGDRATGWLALLIAVGAAPTLLDSAATLMTETTCLAWSTVAVACGVAAARAVAGRRCAWALASGALLGLAALTRPAFLYVLPASLLALPLLGGRRALAPACWFASGAAALLVPWVGRNAAVLGTVALTRGYDSHTLAQRLAFDGMNARDYLMSFVCWLPDGTGLGRALAGPGACDRFGWDGPQSFYRIGLNQLLPRSLLAAGGYEHHLRYLLHTYVFRMPVKHLLVSLPLALRGAAIAHWWGFLLLPACVWATLAAGRGRLPEGRAYLIVALPAWFGLALNAAVAVNQPRYNFLLVPAYAIGGALAARRLWARAWAGRRWRSAAA